jgi:tetratricopeptide (TPR) repeat protein
MSEAQANEGRPPSPKAYRERARQWSKQAWAVALVLGSLPFAGRLVLGIWGFGGAAELACLFLIVGAYFHFVSGGGPVTMPDPAAMLDQANQLAAEGRIDRAIALLTKTIRQSPKLWQAFQYRGELYLGLGAAAALAVRDFSEAIRLAPNEPHLYVLRGQAYGLLGDDASARSDYQRAEVARTHQEA